MGGFAQLGRKLYAARAPARPRGSIAAGCAPFHFSSHRASERLQQQLQDLVAAKAPAGRSGPGTCRMICAGVTMLYASHRPAAAGTASIRPPRRPSWQVPGPARFRCTITPPTKPLPDLSVMNRFRPSGASRFDSASPRRSRGQRGQSFQQVCAKLAIPTGPLNPVSRNLHSFALPPSHCDTSIVRSSLHLSLLRTCALRHAGYPVLKGIILK